MTPTDPHAIFEQARRRLDAAIAGAKADRCDATLAELGIAAPEARRAFDALADVGFRAARERRGT